MFISDDQMLTKLHRGVPENDFSVPRIFFFSLMECLYEFNKAGKGFSPHCYIKCPFLGFETHSVIARCMGKTCGIAAVLAATAATAAGPRGETHFRKRL